jgi:hypothetical protein
VNVACLLLATSVLVGVPAQAVRDLVDLRQIGRICQPGS